MGREHVPAEASGTATIEVGLPGHKRVHAPLPTRYARPMATRNRRTSARATAEPENAVGGRNKRSVVRLGLYAAIFGTRT
jgi:hypothetical protein